MAKRNCREDNGEIRFRGRPLSNYARRDIAKSIALVPQEVQVTFHFTVQQLVEQLLATDPRKLA